jgi:FAD/FMN-containing dehydrogenase
MGDVASAALNGGSVHLDQSAIQALADTLQGTLLTAGSPGYDEARTIWNAMIDRKPSLIAQCATADDVAAAVKFAGANDLLIAVHGCGHNVAGNAVCDGGLMIDLSPMKGISINGSGTVTVEPGCSLGELDAATHEKGCVVPGGIVSSTGVAGLTLGGGFGWLSRKYGMTVDNLLSVNMVLADGSQVTASAEENADLFWGVRGGGGNFGVVTSFTFQSHKLAPEIFCGLIVKPFSEARDFLKFYYEYVPSMPEEMSIWCVMRLAPPLPFLPEEVHGQRVLVAAFMYAGGEAEGMKLIQPIRDFGTTLGEVPHMAPFPAWQAAFDPLQEAGFRNYWKSHNFQEVGEELIEILCSAIENQPSPLCEIFLPHLGGAVSRVDPLDTAYNYRSAPFLLNVHTRWENAADDEKMIGWARKLYEDSKPFADGVYVNFMSDEGQERVHDAYPKATWDRLVEIKRKYDPQNRFRMNQNITP